MQLTVPAGDLTTALFMITCAWSLKRIDCWAGKYNRSSGDGYGSVTDCCDLRSRPADGNLRAYLLQQGGLFLQARGEVFDFLLLLHKAL